MPRSKPDKVVVHRIELGTLERTEMKEYIDAKTKREEWEMYRSIGGTALIGIGGYYGYVAIKQYYNLLYLWLQSWTSGNPLAIPKTGNEDLDDFIEESGIDATSLLFPASWPISPVGIAYRKAKQEGWLPKDTPFKWLPGFWWL